MESLATLDVPNVLLSAPTFEATAREACARLGSADEALIGVTLTRTPDQWLTANADRLPDDVWLVCAGEHARSAGATEFGSVGQHAGVTIRTVSSPGNLTKLGVIMTECVPAAAPAEDASTATLCFESVGALFQYADAKSVFQFFQVLADHVTAHGVRAHYHVDPDAIGEQDVGRLAVLFDAVVDVSEDGEVAVRTQ